MIIDKLSNAEFYYGINEKIKTSLNYLKNTNLLNLENGRYEVDGDDIFVIIQDYQSKPENEGKWEAHRKYTDIQYIIKGRERLGYLNINEFTPDTSYNDEKDIIFGMGSGGFVTAKTGDFVIFTPQDAHMPRICVKEPEYVKKAVIKIKWE